MIPLGQMTYATMFIQNTNPLLTVYSPANNVSSNGNISASGLADVTLVKGISTYYATLVDQNSACSIYSCVLSSTFTCSALPSPPPPCSGVRVAERSGTLSHVAMSSSQLTIDGTYPVNAAVLGAQFQLVAASDDFHLVYVTSSNGLAIVDYDGKSAPSVPAVLSTQGQVLGIDAVADGPNSTGIAIVYVTANASVTSVHFMHLCL